MRRLLLIVLLAASAVVVVPPSAAQGPPLGTFVVGADPAIAGVVAEGVAGWNATGAVTFVVAGGCGEGDVFFCIQPTQHADAMAEWDFVQTSLIRVNPAMLHLFAAGSVCHELGHFLGLRWYADGSVYHRSDFQSCMSVGPGKPAYPDAVDLAFLGVSQGAQGAPAVASGRGNAPVVALPSTGSGPGSW
jgi:hypothetical protein